ncbi:integral membrane protein [Colletotrichum musicola]|uniref:Integral membrane protein n=1 Tax=Colletotrichum musicola TaxID=2175873 RepID=A0A8H6U6I0_9PEZI|nr:integral membrane protein [Colletotrichum musicola]
MPSLFGSKNNKDDDVPEGPPEERGSNEYAAREPDEHTRLLPNRLDSDNRQFLTPDDPAVSPYNLWTVRVMRWATVLFAALTFVWWTLALVSIFVTPPGMHTRGSGFYAFSYSSLSLFTLLFTLVFFGAPSAAVRVLAVFMAVMLLADTILILAVQKNRYEEGAVGVASVIYLSSGAFLMNLWTLLADRTVKWGKAEEEERLTGRVETRRTVWEWTEVLISTIAYVILSIVIILITCTLVLRSLDAGFGPPGEQYWVDGDQYRIHIFCEGTGTDVAGNKLPTVFFEGGDLPVENGLWQLAQGALKNGSIARYCFADRPGYAWSDTAPSPLSAGMATDALSEALARAGENGPWILASAGIGSVYSRIFSSRHGKEVRGILMIDPLHEDLLHRVSAPGRGFAYWVRGIVSPLGLERLPGALFRGRTSADRVWGRSARQSGKYLFTKLQESLVADSLTKREVVSGKAIQYPDTPLVLISSGNNIRQDSVWEEKQRDLSHLTRNLKHWDIVDEAPHNVWETFDGREKIEKRLRQLVQA